MSRPRPSAGKGRHRATREEFIFLMSTWLRIKVPFLNLPTCPIRPPDEMLAAGCFLLDFLRFRRETGPELSLGRWGHRHAGHWPLHGARAPPCMAQPSGSAPMPAVPKARLCLYAERPAAGPFQAVPSSLLGSQLRCHLLSRTGQRPPLHGPASSRTGPSAVVSHSPHCVVSSRAGVASVWPHLCPQHQDTCVAGARRALDRRTHTAGQTAAGRHV